MHNQNVLNESVWGSSPTTAGDWSIVKHRARQKVLLVFGVKNSLSLMAMEFKILCGDIGLGWLVSRALIHMIP